MNFAEGKTLSSLSGKSCTFEQNQCQSQCHGVDDETIVHMFSSTDNPALEHKCGEGLPEKMWSSGHEGLQNEVRDRNTGLGVESLQEKGAGPSGHFASAMSMSEKENHPANFGEITPEQPLRIKGIPAGQGFRPSPLAAHGNSDSARHGHKMEERHWRPYSPADEAGSSHFLSPFQSQNAYSLHQQGNSFRSDVYLRQALTSPYNQRGMVASSHTHNADCRSGGKESSLVYSPSLWREGVGQIQGSPHWDKTLFGNQEGLRQMAMEAEAGHDQPTTFKTPHKSARRAMFNSPDRGQGERVVSGSSSPLSSASGSSSSGHHSGPHNPFEQNQERLHFPTFSPNMFRVTQTPGSAEKFQWNIEHLAELHPVHIDEKDIKRQLSKVWRDEESEQKAQRAIDYYFQHHMVAPSPWSEVPPPHVLPVTPCGLGYEDLMATTPNQAQGSIQRDLPRSKRGLDKSCQTTLTLPLSLDLEKILGEYMTYQDSERDESIGMSSSSLRRKLFFNADSSSIVSPVRSGQKSPDHLSAALNTPPNCRSRSEWDRGSPVHTPSSLQFSSSPIRGPLAAEGDHFRSSFSEHGPLASPELSPIADRRPGRLRQSLGFPSIHDDAEADLGLGSPIRKQLQMEVHDGSSIRERPSPDVSPIAAFGADGSGHHSRSRTLRADMSQSLFPSPLHPSPHHQHPPPHPAFSLSPDPESALPAQRAPPRRRISLSMETDAVDFLPSAEKETGILSPHDSSVTEMTLGEGGTSGLDTDTLQHPSSVSYPDTGYQTGSGNGSLQTTQEGAVSMTTNTSTDAPSNLTDPGSQLKTLALKLQSAVSKQQGVLLRTSADEMKPGARLLSLDENSVDGVGMSADSVHVAHSKLTNQFMSLPIHAELSTISADLNSSLQALSQEQQPPPPLSEDVLRVLKERTVSKDVPVDSRQFLFGTEGSKPAYPSDSSQAQHAVGQSAQLFQITRSKQLLPYSLKESVPLHPQDLAQGQNTKDEPTEPSQRTPPSFIEGDYSEEDDQGSVLNSYIYRHSADFLNKMGDYLEKGGELSDEGSDKGGVAALPCPPSSCARRTQGPDDSVLQRAHQYLASVNYPEGLGKESGLDRGKASTAVGPVPPAQAAGLTTPARKLLGSVAGALTAGRDSSGTPALASDVAQELIRRAELDLKQLPPAFPQKDSS